MSIATANRIPVRQAAKTARDFIEAFYADMGEPVQTLMIEEVELSDDGATWQITVGFSRPTVPDSIPMIPQVIWRKNDRVYKIVDVSSENGEVQGMRIRQVEAL